MITPARRLALYRAAAEILAAASTGLPAPSIEVADTEVLRLVSIGARASIVVEGCVIHICHGAPVHVGAI